MIQPFTAERSVLLLVWLCGMAVGAAVGLESHPSAGGLVGQPAPACSGAGILADWIVTRDDGSLLCEEPSVFARARQIQCE
jgi:hypothetical protein